MEDKKNLSLPENFQDFSDARRNGFLKVKELKENGCRIAGVFCTFTPLEVLYAAGFIPVSLCGMDSKTIPDAEVILPKNLCPLIKSSFGFYISDTCPYTYFADLIVGETTCDGKKKMYEIMGQGKKTFILQLPQGETKKDLENWTQEIHRFISFLETEYNVKISPEALRNASETLNKEREAKEKLALLQKNTPPLAMGLDIYKVLEGVDFLFDHNEKIEKLSNFTSELKITRLDRKDLKPKTDSLNSALMHKNASNSFISNKKRILITGCPIGGVLEKTVGIIEKNLGVVVCFENCTGTKTFSRKTDTSKEDIVSAIAERYLYIGCSVLSPNTERIKNLKKLCEEFNVDGIIDISLHNCLTYSIESYTVNRFAKTEGLPYLFLDTDYTEEDEGQIQTRIEAFLEIL